MKRMGGIENYIRLSKTNKECRFGYPRIRYVRFIININNLLSRDLINAHILVSFTEIMCWSRSLAREEIEDHRISRY